VAGGREGGGGLTSPTNINRYKKIVQGPPFPMMRTLNRGGTELSRPNLKDREADPTIMLS
jgi:hypothetical protein